MPDRHVKMITNFVVQASSAAPFVSTETEQKMNNRGKRFIETLVLFRRSLIYQTKEFFNNSTLHGVRYIADTSRPFGEKFMWFSFTSIGAIAALVIIMSLWEKFQKNPTITGLETDYNQKIIFPTVVVCPVNPYDEAKVKDISYKELGKYKESDAVTYQAFLRALTQLSYQTIGTAYEYTLNFSNPDIVDKVSLRRLAFQVKMNCNDLLLFCRYLHVEVKCCSHFQEIYTEQGFCFAFNARIKSFETKDEQSVKFHDLFETDKKWALNFVPSSPVNVYIHSTTEYFGCLYSPVLRWDPSQMSEIFIGVQATYTTEDAKQLSISQRKCIFNDEVKLKFFPEYTFTGCMNECHIKKCIKLCKCIPPFYAPLSNVPYCKARQLKCLVKYRDIIPSREGCDKCKLSCSKTNYEVQKLNNDFSESVEHSINIEYLTWPIIHYKREVLFGWVDLFVSFGGIAGLFLGFSLLSGVEILYYFTIRACCMVYKNRVELRAIEEEIQRKPPPHFNMSLRIPIVKVNNANFKRRSLLTMYSATKQQIKHDKRLLNSTKRGKFVNATPISNVSTDQFAPKRFKRNHKMALLKRPGIRQVKPTYGESGCWNSLRRKSLDPPQFEFLP